MPAPKKGNPAGFSSIQFSTMTNEAFWTGQAGASPANGTTSHAYLSNLFATANFQAEAQTVVRFRGGDGFVGQLAFGTRLIQQFNIETEATEADLIAMTTGGNADQTTNSVWTIFSPDGTRRIIPNIGLIITQEFQSREAATAGITWYLNTVFPVTTVAFNSGGASHQSATVNSFTVTPTVATKFPNGVAFSSNQSWYGNETDHFFVVSQYPLAYTAFISDASETDVIVGYKPVSTTVTNGATQNWNARNGTAAALTSMTIATATAVMASAGTAADENGILYETEFETVA